MFKKYLCKETVNTLNNLNVYFICLENTIKLILLNSDIKEQVMHTLLLKMIGIWNGNQCRLFIK